MATLQRECLAHGYPGLERRQKPGRGPLAAPISYLLRPLAGREDRLRISAQVSGASRSRRPRPGAGPSPPWPAGATAGSVFPARTGRRRGRQQREQQDGLEQRGLFGGQTLGVLGHQQEYHHVSASPTARETVEPITIPNSTASGRMTKSPCRVVRNT